MKLPALLCSIILMWCSSCALYADDCDMITLNYIERPPYLVKSGNSVEGLSGTPTERAFKQAEIPFEWKEISTASHLRLIEANTGCDCIVSYFKTPEREKYAKYTVPIYQDQPHIAVAWADNQKLMSDGTVEMALKNPEIILEVKKDWSYGKFLDSKIAQYHPKTDETIGDNAQILKKIYAKRADIFFTTPAEADAVITVSGFSRQDFKYITFRDVPIGENRYILCSQKVSDEIIKKFNDAISSYQK